MSYQERTRACSDLPCPACQKTDWCFLTLDQEGSIIQAVCGRTKTAPHGWERKEHDARDGRAIFYKKSLGNHRRKKFPKLIDWRDTVFESFPEWKDYSPALNQVHRGDRLRVRKIKHPAIFDGFGPKGRYKVIRSDGGKQQLDEDFIDGLWTADDDGKEQEIYYDYCDPDGRPHGRVQRRQWSDRRRWYGNKSKQVFPQHAVRSAEGGWIWKTGRGGADNEPWPLYRQREALDALEIGEPVFIVAGEQAVEAMRQLGFTATTIAGGEARQNDVVTHLKDACRSHDAAVLIIWPDNDPTGHLQFGKLQRTCTNQEILAATLNPLDVWPQMPDGGDVFDFVRDSHLNREECRNAIIEAAEMAIDRQEKILVAQQQRKRWGAPDERDRELGFIKMVPNPNYLPGKEADDNNPAKIEAFVPKTDFNFKITRELVGADGGGVELAVRLADYPQERRARISSADAGAKQRFQAAMAKALGHSVICNLNDNQLQALLRVRLLEYRLFEGGGAYRLISRMGHQPDGTWVFKDTQLTADGQETTDRKSRWIWNESINATANGEAFKPPTIHPYSDAALPRLCKAAQAFFGDNFPYALLMMGYVAAGCHYDRIMQAEDGFPTLNAYGDAGSGKTQLAMTALSITGMHKCGMFADTTISAGYQRLNDAGNLAHCFDDPKRDKELDEFFKGLYGAKGRNKRGRDGNKYDNQTPHSPLFFTSNMALGENSQAARSRLAKMFIPSIGVHKSAYAELENARNQASAGLPDLIRLGYDRSAVQEMEQRIKPMLEKAHDRIPRSFALILVYASKIAALGAIEINLVEFCAEHIFPSLNTLEESGNSLRDFVEKVFALRTTSHLGDWDTRITEKRNTLKRILAINLPSVWRVVEKEYPNLPYDMTNLKAVMASKGCEMNGFQRFHKSKALSLSATAHGVNTIEETRRRCVEVPWELIEELADFESLIEKPVDSVDSVDTEPEAQTQQALTLSTDNVDKTENNVDSVDRSGGSEPSAQNPVNKGHSPVNPSTKRQSPDSEKDSAILSTCQQSSHQKTQTQTFAPEPVPKVGDTVVINASASRFIKGSDKLPLEGAKAKMNRRKRPLPLDELAKVAKAIWDELQKPCPVVEVKGEQLIVEAAGLRHCFKASDCHVLPKGGDAHADE